MTRNHDEEDAGLQTQVLVSLRSVAKSGRVLNAFSTFYLPFYGCPEKYLFERFGVFAGISSAIYHIDEAVESSHSCDGVTDYFENLYDHLDDSICIDDHVTELRSNAEAYYQFEAACFQEKPFTLDDLLTMTAMRSFDFRLMHRALVQLLDKPYNDSVFRWFASFEMLIELEDDLKSVEKDFATRSFNAYGLAFAKAGIPGMEFIEVSRKFAEDNIHTLSLELSSQEQRKCTKILEAYRSIVSRPSPDFLRMSRSLC